MCIDLQNGFRLFVCCVLFNISLCEAVGQEIKVRTANTEKKIETTAMPRYDGISPFFDIQELAKNPHYYDGAKILFLPNSTHEYSFFGGFTLVTPIEVPDTLWTKDKKKIKKINLTTTDVYKPVQVNAKQVRYFGMSRKSSSGVTYIESGYKTPVSMIEGKVFTIEKCYSNMEIRDGEHWLVLKMNLKDIEGIEIKWDVEMWMLKSDYIFMPILMYTYIEKYLKCVGNKYVNYENFSVKDTSTIEKVLNDIYECTELSYIEEDRVYDTGFSSSCYYYSPVLFYTHNGEEIHYNIIPEKNYGWLRGKNSISDETFNSLMDPIAFKQRALKEIEERNLKIEEIKKTTLKKIEEKEKAEANRLSELTKKYGTNNAKLIMQSIVQIGWSKQMCIESWGEPSDINKTITSGSVHEQWVYGNNQYLYFDDGKLTAIQN